MRKLAWALPLVAGLGGCGYVAEPLPPSLEIPAPVADLRAVEYGDNLSAAFTIPSLSTDGVRLARVDGAELRVGPNVNPFQWDKWLAGATAIEIPASQPGAVSRTVPLREWIGKEVVMAVRVTGPKRHSSEWSNLWTVEVVEPVPRPTDFGVKATAEGVTLTWRSGEGSFQVWRRGPDDKAARVVSHTEKPEYLDPSAEYGKRYEYSVQAIRGKAESEISETKAIAPADTFPPAVPAGLTGIAGSSSIELAWERNLEADLKGYQIYRSVDGGPLVKIAGIETPAYSDHDVKPGKRYRYAVSAVDQVGNESNKSAPVDVAMP